MTAINTIRRRVDSNAMRRIKYHLDKLEEAYGVLLGIAGGEFEGFEEEPSTDEKFEVMINAERKIKKRREKLIEVIKLV